MDGVSDEDLVVARGLARTVAYARDATGRRPAWEFLHEEIPARDRAQLFHLFNLLAATGRIANQRKFRKERGEIWGIKSVEVRIAAFQHGRAWFLTHGFFKRADKWPAAELERAERIRWEHLVRQLRKGGGG